MRRDRTRDNGHEYNPLSEFCVNLVDQVYQLAQDGKELIQWVNVHLKKSK